MERSRKKSKCEGAESDASESWKRSWEGNNAGRGGDVNEGSEAATVPAPRESRRKPWGEERGGWI